MEFKIMRIAILGNDSTHTYLFAKLLLSNPYVENIRINLNSIWGENEINNSKLEKEFGKKLVKKNIEDALYDIDFALVLGRFPDSHFKHAHYAISKGIGVFVDKPVFENIKDAEIIIDLAKKNNVFFCGGSALRFCDQVNKLKQEKSAGNSYLIIGPSRCIDMGEDSRFDNVNFYGYHLVEILLELIGNDIKSSDFYFNKGDFYVNIKSKNGSGRIILLDNINESYFLGKTINSNLKMSEILLDGSYNLNLIKKLIKSYKNKNPLIEHKSTLNAINILNKMNHIKSNKK